MRNLRIDGRCFWTYLCKEQKKVETIQRELEQLCKTYDELLQTCNNIQYPVARQENECVHCRLKKICCITQQQ